MGPERAPAFQFYARDWLVDTAHLPLDCQGAYARLLCHQWIEGAVPSDLAEVARLIAETPRKTAAIWKRIARLMPAGEDGLRRCPWLEAERARQAEYRKRQSEIGKRGARRRWGDGDGNAGANGGGIGGGNAAAMPEAMPNAWPDDGSASASATAQKPDKDERPSRVPRATWLTPYADLWQRMLGAELPYGVAAKSLAPLHKQHGEESVLRHLGNYLDAHRGERASYVSLPKFAATFGQWDRRLLRGSAGQQRSFEAIERVLGAGDGE